MDATLRSFNEQGCFKINLDHVLAEVGIGKGTLYRHYPSREDLFKATRRVSMVTLRVRCEDVWETHAKDPEAGFRAVIGELVSLNRRREAGSPATLARLDCHCQSMSKSDPDCGSLEAVLSPLVRRWQAVRLLDQAADPSLIAAAIVALVNSPAIINYSSGEPDITDRLVELLRRAFQPVRGSVSTAEEP